MLWDDEYRLITTGDFAAAGFPSRSEGDLSACYGLVRCNWTDAQIVEVFETFPIGKKYRELGGAGLRYPERTIAKARELDRTKWPRETVRAVIIRARRWGSNEIELRLRPMEGRSAGYSGRRNRK